MNEPGDRTNFWKRRHLNRRSVLRGGAGAAMGVAGIGLVGCGGDDDDSENGTPTNGESGNGGNGTATAESSPGNGGGTPTGTLNVSVNTLMDGTTDPFRMSGGLFTPLFAHMTEGLYRTGLDAQPEPGVAESLEQEDELTWVYRLRPGIKFSDGSDVTVDDVVWSFEMQRDQDPPTALTSELRERVESVEATDETTITMTLKAPTNFQLREMGDGNSPRSWPIAKRAHYEEVGPDEFARGPITTAPFHVVRNEVGSVVEMEANPHYWDPARKARVQTVILNVVPELQSRMAQLRTGEADIIEGVAGAAAQSLQNESGISIETSAATALLRINFFHLMEDWDDPRLREALGLAIDQQGLVDGLLRTGSPSPNAMMFPSTRGWDEERFPPRPYNIERARSLVQEAGAEGLTFPFHTYVSSSYQLIPQVCEAIAASWSDIGLNPELQQLEAGAYFQQFNNRELRGVGVNGWPSTSCLDPGLFAVNFYFTGASFATMDDIPGLDESVDEIAAESDPERQLELALQVHERGQEEFLFLTAPYNDSSFGVRERVQNWQRVEGNPYTTGLETVELADA